MKSYQFRDYGQTLEAIEGLTPEPVGTELLIRVMACGACHSDVHVWEGHYDMGGGRKLDVRSGRDLPFTLGHEIVGEVVALGPETEGAAIGDRRVIFPWIGCGTCETCERGDEHLCLKTRAIGTFVQGGYSDHVMVPHARYLFDYGDVDPKLACTYACSGVTAFSAVRKVMGQRGRHIVILGAGGVGLSALRMAKALTDFDVIVVDQRQDALDAATGAGADHVVDTTADDANRQIKSLSNGGPCAAVDCVGATATAKLGMRCLAMSGTLVVVGLFGGSLEVSLPLLPLKNLTLRGSFLGSLAEMDELMSLVRAGRIGAIPVETRPLTEAQRTLDDLAAGNVVGRVVLTP
jgi:D-arabinose 1-dehydrogenase-like Zn-dependent alcohol dehydrogenase